MFLFEFQKFLPEIINWLKSLKASQGILKNIRSLSKAKKNITSSNC